MRMDSRQCLKGKKIVTPVQGSKVSMTQTVQTPIGNSFSILSDHEKLGMEKNTRGEGGEPSLSNG